MTDKLTGEMTQDELRTEVIRLRRKLRRRDKRIAKFEAQKAEIMLRQMARDKAWQEFCTHFTNLYRTDIARLKERLPHDHQPNRPRP